MTVDELILNLMKHRFSTKVPLKIQRMSTSVQTINGKLAIAYARFVNQSDPLADIIDEIQADLDVINVKYPTSSYLGYYVHDYFLFRPNHQDMMLRYAKVFDPSPRLTAGCLRDKYQR